MPLRDVSSEADPEAAALAFMQRRFEEPFALEGQPLFRYDLIKRRSLLLAAAVSPPQHRRLGRGSAEPLLGEIYSALAAAETPDLEAPSYTAYIKDDRAYVESAKFEQQRAFWRQHHPQSPEPLLTPYYRGHFSGALAGSGCEAMALPREVYDRLGALAEAHGVSLFHVLLVALYVYSPARAR